MKKNLKLSQFLVWALFAAPIMPGAAIAMEQRQTLSPKKQRLLRRLVANYKELRELRAKRRAGMALPVELKELDERMRRIRKQAIAAGLIAAILAAVGVGGTVAYRKREAERAERLLRDFQELSNNIKEALDAYEARKSLYTSAHARYELDEINKMVDRLNDLLMEQFYGGVFVPKLGPEIVEEIDEEIDAYSTRVDRMMAELRREEPVSEADFITIKGDLAEGMKRELGLDRDKEQFEWFEVLGLDKSSGDKAVVRKKYKALSLRFHPDKYRGDAELGGEIFKVIGDAYLQGK